MLRILTASGKELLLMELLKMPWYLLGEKSIRGVGRVIHNVGGINTTLIPTKYSIHNMS